MNSYGLGNIGWVNLGAPAGPSGPTDANEGLTVIGGFVQLGIPAPDPTKNITVPRYVAIEDGATLAFGSTGGSGTGNVLVLDPVNGDYFDTQNANPPGERTRYHFSFNEFAIRSSSAVTSINFYDDFPVGVLKGVYGMNGADLIMTSYTGDIYFNQSELSVNIADGGFGVGINVGYAPSTTTSMMTFSDSSNNPAVLAGVADYQFGGNKYMIWGFNGSNGWAYAYDFTNNQSWIGTPANAGNSAILNLGDSFATIAALNFVGQQFPNTPADGDMWNFGNDLWYHAGFTDYKIARNDANAFSNNYIPFWDSGFYTASNQLTFNGSYLLAPNFTTGGSPGTLDNDGNGTAWTFQEKQAGAVVFDTANFVNVTINGVAYKLALAV